MNPLIAMSALAAMTAQQPVTFQTIASDRAGYYTTSVRVPLLAGSPLGDFATAKLKGIAANGLAKWMLESTSALETEPTRPYSYTAVPIVSVSTPQIVSMYFKVSSDTGGAHPMTVSDPHTFAMVDGKPEEIGARELFRPGYDVVAGMSSLVMGRLLRNNQALWVQNGEVKALTAAQVNRFVVTKTALTFLFDPYEMGPYSSGAFQVKIPFTEIQHDLDANGPLRSLLK